MADQVPIELPSADDLQRQNAALDGQIKQLVRTEKRLYRIQKDLDRQMQRVDSLNRLALNLSLTFDAERILAGALESLAATLYFDLGAGLIAEGEDRLRVCAWVGLSEAQAKTKGGRRADAAAFCSWTAPLLFDSANPPDLPPDVPALLDELLQEEETDRAIVLILPLRLPKDNCLVGLLLLCCCDISVISVHSRLVSKQDLPFVSLVRAHIEAALEKAFLYKDLTDLTRNLEEKVKERTAQLEYYAARDPLTDLYNHRIFWELLEYEVMRSDRHGRPFGLLVIDIDNFKAINDSYGHERGDRCLVELAEKMRRCLRVEDVLARYGGDEFAVIMTEADTGQSYSVAQRLLRTMSLEPIDLGGGESVPLSLSIGLATFPEHARNARELFLLADNAVYRAKREGKHTVCIPRHDDLADSAFNDGDKLLLAAGGNPSELLVPFFQPVLDLRDGSIAAYEVLMRILVDGQMLEAAEFVHQAERLGIINRLDNALQRKVFERLAQERFAGMIFLNLSPRALMIKEFTESVLVQVRKFGIAPERIVFEITERETVKNLELIETFVHQLRSEGFRFAVDDFGSGYSSLHYIKKFSVDLLKIDGEFIRGMLENNVDRAFVHSIVALARDLKIRTVAECVENEDILRAVGVMGVDYAQGHHVGKPCPDLADAAARPVGPATGRRRL
jgi:diguanylate cyclase (GGDEF)-like protein